MSTNYRMYVSSSLNRATIALSLFLGRTAGCRWRVLFSRRGDPGSKDRPNERLQPVRPNPAAL